MKLKPIITAAALALSLPLMSMPAHADRELTSKVKAALNNSGAQGQKLQVRTKSDNTVALSGTVQTKDQLREAVAAAKSVPGVTQVEGSFDVLTRTPPSEPVR